MQMASGTTFLPMRSLAFLVVTTAATTAAAQQPSRPPCRDCSPAEARAAAEMRAVQVRDSLRALGGGGFENEIERLAAQLMLTTQLQMEVQRNLESIVRGRVQAANRKEVEMTAARLRTQLSQASREREVLRGQLTALCDRTAKPQGYMGITFSATMRADTSGAGAQVFRFAELPTVETVEPGSPAERAGIATGDEIVSIGGQSVMGRDIEFTRLLRPGARLPLRVRRDGEDRDVVLLVGRRPAALDNGCPWLDARITAAFADAPIPMAPLPPARGAAPVAPPPPSVSVTTIPGRVRVIRPAEAPSAPTVVGGGVEVVVPPTPLVPSVPLSAPTASEARSAERTVIVFGGSRSLMMVAGATIVPMNSDLRESFGVRNGVLVVDVARGSQAYSSGLKGGDVIVSVGRSPVTLPVSIRRAMETADGRELTLRIVRKKKTQSLVLRW